MTEVFSYRAAICRSLAELRIKAVTGLMITVETHAGTVSLLSTVPTFHEEKRAWSYCTTYSF